MLLLTQALEARVEAVTFPTAQEHLTEDQPLDLKPGEYLAQSFTSPPGEGSVDPNHQTVTQTIEYEDIRVNEVNPDYFSVGGF